MEVLGVLHERYKPRSYFEVGVQNGSSLALSRTSSIGIDPDFSIVAEIDCDLQLVRSTSDDFFARSNPLAHFSNDVIDLAFIDGLHVFEFALRDFMNIERHSTWTSVIAVDDVFPRNTAEASRDQGSNYWWAGDVYKIMEVLRAYRPDLVILPVDDDPTGLLLVLGADPTNTTLQDHYDEIVRRQARPDPQQVPQDVLERRDALQATPLMQADFWDRLVKARDMGLDRDAVFPDIEREVREASRPAPRRDLTPGPVPAMRLAAEHSLAQHAVASARRNLRHVRHTWNQVKQRA